ncbi:hypothetical protein N9B94_01995 [Verrucomicrobia bacterium]|nr:hypothetical protein [Verrucomicrobiota bacterium]
MKVCRLTVYVKWMSRVLCAAFVVSASANDLGPILDKIRLTLEPGYGYEAAGPLWGNYKLDEDRDLWRLSPIISETTNKGADSQEIDFLYPLLSYDRYGDESRFHIGQLIAFAGGRRGDDGHDKRFTLFPFYFQQRSTDPEKNYTGLMPFYGTLKNRLFRDEVKWVMAPLYIQSRKRDVVTDNYLYPFIHVRKGDGLQGWQFLPFYGQEEKEVTYSTNKWNETVMSPGHEKTIIGWPFYSFERRGLGSENPVLAHQLLPFYAIERSHLRDSTTVLWPFMRYATDETDHYREWNFPWPFVVFARGDTRRIDRVWPIWSDTRSEFVRSRVFLFPLWKEKRIESPEVKSRRTRVALFLYNDIHDENLETGLDRRQRALWPLFTWKKDYDGRSRLQVLAPLEPLIRNNSGIERNYSPLWSIYRKETNVKTKSQSHSILWNLFRTDRKGTSKKISLLFGLFRYESTPSGAETRLFHFIRIGKKVKSSDTKDSEEPAAEAN